MGKINSRQKGARGEREFAELLRARGHEAKRGQQFKGGDESPDVISSLPIHFEVKRVENFSVYDSLRQAVRDANGKKVPVVAHRRNGRKWVAVMLMDDLLDLVERDLQQSAKPVRCILRRS